jgi:hypothetical protein
VPPPPPPPSRSTTQLGGPGGYYPPGRRAAPSPDPRGAPRQARGRAGAYPASTDLPTQTYGATGGTARSTQVARVGQPVRGPRTGVAPSRRPVRAARAVAARRLVVRHVDVLSVLKLSLFFYFCVLVVLLVAGTVLWNVAEAAGAIGKLDKLVRSLFALSSFQLHPLDALLWGGPLQPAFQCGRRSTGGGLG